MRCLSPSQVVSKGVGDGFILTDLIIIYTRFGSSQPPVSLEITTIASLTRNTSTITSKRLLKKELTYSSNTFQGSFYAEFCCCEGISCFQTNWALAQLFKADNKYISIIFIEVAFRVKANTTWTTKNNFLPLI